MTTKPSLAPSPILIAGLLLLAILIAPVGLLVGAIGCVRGAKRHDRRATVVDAVALLLSAVTITAFLLQRAITAG